MNINIERNNGILIVTPEGRLDAFESSHLGKELETALQEDSYLVLDMAKVPYLSSGGIRVLLINQKKLARKNGQLYLCGLSGYPQQVIKMAGMNTIFNICDTVEKAVKQISELEKLKQSEKDWRHLPSYHLNQTSFHVFHTEAGPASLKIVGNLLKLMHASLEPDDIRQRRFSETEYSIGLGALGGSLEDCVHLLGEMITIGGTMVWLPTDGNDTPDFLIPQIDTGEVVIHTGLNLALEGGFSDIILIGGAAGNRPVSFTDLYEALFSIAHERKMPHSNLISVAMIADLEDLFSSGIKISPIKTFAPDNNGMITDPENIAQWMDINAESKHAGHTMVSFGIGLDLTSGFTGLPKATLDNVFYLHPANVGNKKMLLHNHGVVFESLKWRHTLDLDSEIRRIAHQGNFIDMRHLLDTTRIKRAVAGISYISDIRME